ncbi:hypothetical protein TB2_034721 [Malus domestica]
MNKDLDLRWKSESDFCSDLPHFSAPKGFRLWSFAVAGGEDENQHLAWHAVASWTWDAQDETCGICRMAFDGCCPDCKLPGDDFPLRSQIIALGFHYSRTCCFSDLHIDLRQSLMA